MRMVKALSDTTIKNAKPKEQDYTIPDGKGLHLRIKTNGVKVWEFVFMSPMLLKRRKVTLNHYPIVTLEQARGKRDAMLSLIAQGIDPVEKERENQSKLSPLFQDVVNAWFQSQEGKKKEVTLSKKRGLFKMYVTPYFHNRDTSTITTRELAKVIEAKNKTAPETARRLMFYLRDLWAFAITHEYCTTNPVLSVHKDSVLSKPEHKVYAAITKPETFKELMQAIYSYRHDFNVRNILKFVAHVPLRAENLSKLRWEQIDFDKRLLAIHRSEMKSKQGTEYFELPLTDEAIAILKEQYSFNSHIPYVFSIDGKNHINQVTPNKALSRMGFDNEEEGRKQRLHSFRSSYRSIIDIYQHENGFSDDNLKELILDHSNRSSASKSYARGSQAEALRPILTWWSRYILAMVEVKV